MGFQIISSRKWARNILLLIKHYLSIRNARYCLKNFFTHNTQALSRSYKKRTNPGWLIYYLLTWKFWVGAYYMLYIYIYLYICYSQDIFTQPDILSGNLTIYGENLICTLRNEKDDLCALEYAWKAPPTILVLFIQDKNHQVSNCFPTCWSNFIIFI